MKEDAIEKLAQLLFDKIMEKQEQSDIEYAEQIQKSLDMLANMPKMNIPVIHDMEEIRQKMADANIPFSTPISFQEQLQTIKDLPPMLPVFFSSSGIVSFLC